MKDIVDKVDRAKAILRPNNPVNDPDAKELVDLALDALGELLANSRRIAVALEAIALNTQPQTKG